MEPSSRGERGRPQRQIKDGVTQDETVVDEEGKGQQGRRN